MQGQGRLRYRRFQASGSVVPPERFRKGRSKRAAPVWCSSGALGGAALHSCPDNRRARIKVCSNPTTYLQAAASSAVERNERKSYARKSIQRSYPVRGRFRIPHYNHILEKKPLVDWFEGISAIIVRQLGFPRWFKEVSDPFDQWLAKVRGASVSTSHLLERYGAYGA